MNPLLRYLDRNGILLCNTNPELPALEDVGCSWSDVTELIDRQELFYCKAFKNGLHICPQKHTICSRKSGGKSR